MTTVFFLCSIFKKAVVKMWATTHTASAVKLQSRFDLWVFKKYNALQNRNEIEYFEREKKKQTENDTSCHW